MRDNPFQGIEDYINGPEGKAVEKKVIAYYEKAKADGRICEKCRRAIKEKVRKYSFAHYRSVLCETHFPKEGINLEGSLAQ